MVISKIFTIGLAVLLLSCSPNRNEEQSFKYPQPLPDSGALPFLPGIVSRDSLDFNAAFSPDGKRFYFSRSSKGKWIIYVTEFREERWSNPAIAPFNEPDHSQADPFITSDGTLYYISNRPRDSQDTLPDYDIWFTRPEADGSWSDPENVINVNTDSTEYYVSLSSNGNLYFASNREGTHGSHDIYMSRYADGVYLSPENLGVAINSTHMEHDPMIAPDEQFLIFTSVDRSDSHGEGDLYYSLRNEDGSWTSAKNMGTKFNTNSYEYCSYLTPDSKYLFYSSNYDVKWIDCKHLPWKQQ